MPIRNRQTPQLRAVSHRHHALNQDHRLLARRTALPAARRRRHPSNHRPSPSGHRRTLRHTQRPPRPTQNHHRHSKNGPAKQGVAKRSINRSVQNRRYDPHSGLTSVRKDNGGGIWHAGQRISRVVLGLPRISLSVRRGDDFVGDVISLRRELQPTSVHRTHATAH